MMVKRSSFRHALELGVFALVTGGLAAHVNAQPAEFVDSLEAAPVFADAEASRKTASPVMEAGATAAPVAEAALPAATPAADPEADVIRRLNLEQARKAVQTLGEGVEVKALAEDAAAKPDAPAEVATRAIRPVTADAKASEPEVEAEVSELPPVAEAGPLVPAPAVEPEPEVKPVAEVVAKAVAEPAPKVEEKAEALKEPTPIAPVEPPVKKAAAQPVPQPVPVKAVETVETDLALDEADEKAPLPPRIPETRRRGPAFVEKRIPEEIRAAKKVASRAANAPLPRAVPESRTVALSEIYEPPADVVPQDAPEVERLTLSLNNSKIITLKDDVRDVLVSNPAIADVQLKTGRLVYLLARGAGDTNIFFLDKEQKIISQLELSVSLDVDTIAKTMKEVFPDERIHVSSVNDTVLLKGNVTSDRIAANAGAVARRFVAADENIVNLLSVSEEQQVLLKVRVAEIQRSILKELGVNHGYGSVTSGTYFMQFGSAAANGLTGGGIGSTALNQVAVGRSMPGKSFSSVFDMLETNNLLKTLAEPNMTAISGETASLLAGGEYPIPVSDSNGQVTFEFKPYGVGLSFTPVVVGGGRISLKLATEVSALSSERVTTANTQIPGLNVRRANTSVELPSGGSLMIAGLLQNDVVQGLNGIPGIRDVPILGALFNSTSFQRNETELVISITAYIVEPQDPNKLASPTDGFAPSNDLDRVLLGRLHQVYDKGPTPPPAESLEGPIGYIME